MTPILGVDYHLIRRGRYSGFPKVDAFPTHKSVSDIYADSLSTGVTAAGTAQVLHLIPLSMT